MVQPSNPKQATAFHWRPAQFIIIEEKAAYLWILSTLQRLDGRSWLPVFPCLTWKRLIRSVCLSIIKATTNLGVPGTKLIKSVKGLFKCLALNMQ